MESTDIAQTSDKSTGALVGSIIIIVILIIGGIYLIGKSQNAKKENNPVSQPAASASGADSLTSLESDLNASGANINSADQGLQ